MLRGIDAVAFVGAGLVILALVFSGLHYGHASVWREWLLSTALWIAGCTLLAAWPLLRFVLAPSREHDEEEKEKKEKEDKAAAGKA